MGTHHFTAGYSNPVLIISAISHRIRLESFFFFSFVHLATKKVLFQSRVKGVSKCVCSLGIALTHLKHVGTVSVLYFDRKC